MGYNVKEQIRPIVPSIPMARIIWTGDTDMFFILFIDNLLPITIDTVTTQHNHSTPPEQSESHVDLH